MAKNLIPEIAKMLGVAVGEEFKIKGHKGLTYKFDNNELMFTYDKKSSNVSTTAHATFLALLRGETEIVKLPWKPREGVAFYTFHSSPRWKVAYCFWHNSPSNFAMYKAGWVFRTREEAEAALPAVAREFKAKYEL